MEKSRKNQRLQINPMVNISLQSKGLEPTAAFSNHSSPKIPESEQDFESLPPESLLWDNFSEPSSYLTKDETSLQDNKDQHMVATFLQTLFLAMMFARMTGPNKVDQKVYVSKDALITLRNGKLYLTFRVYYIWNAMYDRGAAAVAYCVMDTVTEADRKECLTRCRDIREIPVGFTLEGQDSNIPLITPTLVSHCIDKTSPLYNMDPDQLKNSNIEIIVCLTEKHTETGVDINIRTSFAADEIIWGARFNLNRGFTRRKRGNMLSFADDDINEWELDENTPKMSAMALESKNQGIQE